MANVSSPNGSLAATVIETNGGATTSFGYDITVGLKGSTKTQRVASLYGAIRNEQAYGVTLVWPANNVLEIEYLRAKAVLNVSKSVVVGGHDVQVVLESGVNDPKAPAGGMFFNRKKQSR